MTAVRPTPRRPLRVAYVMASFDVGGTELNAVRTAERLDPSRFQLEVICLRDGGPLRSRYERLGVPITPLPIRDLYGPSAWRSGMRFRHRVDDNADIVHAHDVYANIFAAMWLPRRLRPALITSRRWWSEVPRPALRSINRLAYRGSARVLANSDAVGRLLEQHERVPRARIVVIPNFVDDDAFAPLEPADADVLRREWRIEAGDLVIGTVANLRPIKNQAMLLRGAARLVPEFPSLRVVIIGEGPERRSLESLASELGISARVVLAGGRPHQPAVQRLFDVVTLTSHGEGFPNAIVEAMAAGRPVVATAVGGVPDAVVPEQTGLLVPDDDVESLTTALGRLLRSPSERERMGGAAETSAMRRFHARNVLPQLESLYEELAGGRERVRDSEQGSVKSAGDVDAATSGARREAGR